MTISLAQTYTAIGAGLTSSFQGIGGTAPYSYSVIAGASAAGGSINSSTGVYTAPSVLTDNASQSYDTIQVTDAHSNTATAQILVGSPLILFCDILQNQLGLDNNHLYLWDQKILQPTDSNLYIAVGVINSRPFGNSTRYIGSSGGMTTTQAVNMWDNLSIDAISRGPAARDQRANIIAALNSYYAESQQEANGFKIGTLPWDKQFINLSEIDGAAIPYRFRISVTLQYFVQIVQSVPYFNQFETPEIITNA